jgi:hypothetical protein
MTGVQEINNIISGWGIVGKYIVIVSNSIQKMFNVAEGGIKALDWVIIVGATSFVLWIGQFVRRIKK